ncbi:carboxymuconolactone decarboxylase family protein, partial [Streptomyces albidoflavus]
MTTENTPTAPSTSTTPTTSTTPDEKAAAYLPEHTPRISVAELAPDLYRALARADAAARKNLDPVIGELVKIRASQINHCAFCLDMHTKDALAMGESVERIVQLSAWEESKHYYT